MIKGLDLKATFPDSNSRLQFYVNSEYKELETIDPKTTLLAFLRSNGYTGTKYGCGEGGCGACCVVVAEFVAASNQIRYRTANSCLLPVCAVHGKQVITVEGIGCPKNPHPIQERFAKGNASQCGFCTPGFVMSLYGLLKITPDPTMRDIEEAFDGNLCRCTGYRPILDSARSFIKTNKLIDDFEKFKDYDSNADPQFPVQLTTFKPNSTLIVGDASTIWLRPSSLDELLRAKCRRPDARLIGGNSEVGIEMSSRPLNQPSVLVYVGDLAELRDVRIEGVYLEIGVNITLTELINSLEGLKNSSKPHEKPLLEAFLSNLRWFASRHVRNFATLGGNIATGSPISDLNPILVATDAELTIRSATNGERRIKMREFFISYRKVDVNPDEVLIKVRVRLPESRFERISAFKQAKRKVDDIALVNGCFRVKLDENLVVQELDVSVGGVSEKTVYLKRLNKASRGMVWGTAETLKQLERFILDDVKIDYSAPGAHPTYRRALVVSFLTRFWYHTVKDLGIGIVKGDGVLQNIDEIKRDVSTSSHDLYSATHEPHLGATTPHVAAMLHTTGVATYTDDIPKQAGELFAWPVMSTKAHAVILDIDYSRALAVKGVHAFISHKDVPNSNIWGVGNDEEFFASEKVLFHGQIIGLIVAENASLAKLGAHLVQITYQELTPVLTIDDAIEAGSFYQHSPTISKGTLDEKTFEPDNSCDDLIHQGVFEMGGQEHFYLETFSCLVIPKRESDEWEIHSTTQYTGKIQDCAAKALGVPKNRIVSICKRIGGGFGGKEMRTCLIAIPCVVAANKLNKPIRCVLDRDMDMILTGKRHSFKSWYKVRVTRGGFFKAFDLMMINNGGHSLDMSAGVIDRAITHSDNVYYFPNIRVSGKIAKTNTASNTAYNYFSTSPYIWTHNPC